LQKILLSSSGRPITHIIYNISSIIDIVKVFFYINLSPRMI